MVYGVDRNEAADGSGSAITPVPANLIDAKGDLIVGTADNTPARLAAGANETRLVADSGQTAGVKYVADTTNYAIGAKGDLLVGTAADTVAPKAAGTDGYVLKAQSGTTDGLQYLPPQAGFALENGYLAWTVASNILTISILTEAGAAPSATDPVYVVFRNVTPGTGSLVRRKLTAATSIAVPDTALLGTVNSTAFRLWAVAFDDAGTVRLGVINCLSGTNIYPLAGWGIASSTAVDAASDSAHVFYTGSAVASKAYATLGFASWESGLATAGTWSAGPTRAQLFGLGMPLPGQQVQVQRNESGALVSGATTMPSDDTIPQSTEGVEVLTQAITPTSAANVLLASSHGILTNSGTGAFTMASALFRDAVANALAAMGVVVTTSNYKTTLALRKAVLAGSAAATTFKLRVGCDVAGTTYFNGSSGARSFGGVANGFLEVQEIMA